MKLSPFSSLPVVWSSLGAVAGILLLILSFTGCQSPADIGSRQLRDSVTLYASFDGKLDADFAVGDPALYFAPSMKLPRVGTPGLPSNGVVAIAKGEGRFGDALRFAKKAEEVVFFKAEGNVSYQTNDWQGTISLWLRVEPAVDLAPSYCDPIQITPRAWNDAAFFVEFEKRPESIPFRLGAYADLKVWNPQNRDWDKIPTTEKPLLHVERPPFAGDRWTHVAFTFENFNTGRPNGIATLYLNGIPHGVISPREQTFTWDPAQTLIMMGLSYIGLWDELAIFNRALSAKEVQSVYELDGGIRTLLRPL